MANRRVDGSGPLVDLRVVELAGLGPAPFACMVLADLGAQVVRIDRVGSAATAGIDVLERSRRRVAVDLGQTEGIELVLQLLERSDVLIEGFRPGVTERLGLGPDVVAMRAPHVVYGRVTGWGQQGPLAPRAGHDIDYAALSGALHPIGVADRPPPPPVNYVADFGGGGMLLAVGVLAALWHRQQTGTGQVVDAAMVDGAAAQTTMLHGMMAAGAWTDRRESNLLDGAAPFYRAYATSDGGYMAVGALEPRFQAELLDVLGLDPHEWAPDDITAWPRQRVRLAEVFAKRTRDEWEEAFADRDACVAPVLSLAEAPAHPHARARSAFVEVDGVVQPAPAPRFSATPTGLPRAPAAPGQDTDAVLAELGYDAGRVTDLRQRGVVG